jgi:hypothetical protein
MIVLMPADRSAAVVNHGEELGAEHMQIGPGQAFYTVDNGRLACQFQYSRIFGTNALQLEQPACNRFAVAIRLQIEMAGRFVHRAGALY